jgi:hypothetical protein
MSLTSRRSKNLCPPTSRLGIDAFCKLDSIDLDKALYLTFEMLGRIFGTRLTKDGKVTMVEHTARVRYHAFDFGCYEVTLDVGVAEVPDCDSGACWVGSPEALGNAFLV